MCANTYDNWHKNVSTKNPQSRTYTIYIMYRNRFADCFLQPVGYCAIILAKSSQ